MKSEGALWYYFLNDRIENRPLFQRARLVFKGDHGRRNQRFLRLFTERRTVKRSYDLIKTKSSYRTLSLIPHIREILLAEKSHQEEMKRSFRGGYHKEYKDYICADALGDIFTPQYVTSHFHVVLKQNGLKEIRFHDLRHLCASMLFAQKVPMKMIQDWLGHSDMGKTADIYSHLN